MTPHHTLRATVVAACLLAASAAWATNGMLMEGYGPEALGLGGASQAVENGTAAMANNPATLQLSAPGARFDLALGLLGPSVKTTVGNYPMAVSGGDSYVMPALGWVRNTGRYSYGVGVMGQGGMGTEYAADTALAMGTGADVRSELAVGRLIFPVAMKVSPDFNIGASLDYAWMSLDMKMAATVPMLSQMVTGADGAFGQALGNPAGPLSQAQWARIDFSDNNDFTGKAKTRGWTGKLGMTWQPMPGLMLGASHHLKTSLPDMETSARGARISAGGYNPATGQAVTGLADEGRITVRNFQMPATTALGLAWQASPTVMVAMDVKRVGWASSMKQFAMTYTSAGDMMPGSVDFAMPQHWKDQTVVSLGAAYRVSDALTLRAGYNHADNPIPDAYVNPLFPATVKTHYTLGLGYQLTPSLALQAALSHAPSVRVNSGSGAVITHSQTNYQMLLAYRY